MRVRSLLRVASVLGLAIGLIGCGRDLSGPGARPTARLAKLTGEQVVKGDVGPGNHYGLWVPAAWNGDLVLYAHGYSQGGGKGGALFDEWSPEAAGINCTGGTRVAYACFYQLAAALLDAGYAVAQSSYSYNGLALKDAQVRTAQLESLFAARFGKPAHTYIISHSMGGAVSMALVEKHPGLLDGAMPVCGIVAGVPFQLEYYATVRALFDYYFPGALPGDAVTPTDFAPALAVGALTASPAALAAAAKLASVDQVKMAYTSPMELVQEIVNPLVFNGASWFARDVMAETQGHPYFDNTGVVYTGPADAAALNAGIDRFRASPDAVNALAHLYAPTGELKTPVLTLHDARDPVVSYLHETTYAELVARKGASQWLVNRTIDRFGHCALSVDEEMAAFTALVSWVKDGVRP